MSINNSVPAIDLIDDADILERNNNNNNNNTIYSNKLTFPKRKLIDIEFHDVKYTVRKFSFSKREYERKEILHGISGSFRSGQLSLIMGPSGAGKSTLLNLLAGYVQSGVTGNILVNGKQRSNNSQSFRNLSAYIHQDDALRKYLTVGESMTFAANLKLGYKISTNHKKDLIQRILITLGLENRYNTYTGSLSGGQKKRLAIALEMINNPPVIFLDEPTTGLDSSSCTLCISLLKRLAQEGRTIVCTIHQPSALLFEMFDKLYAIKEGNCMYQGTVKEFIPFMSEQGLQCPNYHNPADFLMEIAVGEYDVDHSKIISSALKKYYEDCDKFYMANTERIILDNNGTEIISSPQSNEYDGTDDDDDDDDEVQVNVKNINNNDNINNNNNFELNEITPVLYTAQKTQQASIIMQYVLLLQRNFMSTLRNTVKKYDCLNSYAQLRHLNFDILLFI